ncbi:MAG TPA: serine/threonine-protein kinase [Polyangiaceae bacterium]|nr:serine/threonine-protein kinase [Polyangiaceae bacterium]
MPGSVPSPLAVPALPGIPAPLHAPRAVAPDAPTLIARSGTNSLRRWPRRAGAYELTRFISAGGMGMVFEARHRLGGERVALKFMDPDAHYPQKEARFSREIIALRTLHHENTARFVDFGRTLEGLRFLAMEYVAGMTLADLVAQNGPLPARRALSLLRQLCGAMAEAHSAGIAHRDLKPSNVMVTTRVRRADWIKVIDFGLAKLPGVTPPGESTVPGIFLGTPGYAPPEVWSRAGVVEATGDVYAIGLIAHHLFTGCTPPDPVEALVHNSQRIVADLERHVPARLVSVITRCLSTDPSARFADAGELARALPTA